MRRVSVVAFVVVAAVVPAWSPAGGGVVDDPCGRSSWTAGTVDLCSGTLVYRDYIWDDFGANTDPTNRTAPQPADLSPASGDDRYPEGQNNTADLVSLRLRLDGDRSMVTFELNTLFDADTTLAAIAIDTDDDGSTGGGMWADGEHSLNVASDGWDELHILDRGDPATNLLTASFPTPAGQRWRIQAVTAQADGTVMNVAFRGDEPLQRADQLRGIWFENRQADVLASGDITEFGHEVEVAELRSGETRRAPLQPGLHERVYRSAYTVGPGEGWSYEGVPGPADPEMAPGDFAQSFQYFGHYQAYGIYVPAKPAPHGVQLVMHGLGANLASLINGPGMQRTFGDDLNRILVVPEGRGQAGFYSHISERDVLDVLADVRATYDVDDDRIFLGGYSMGGYGTLALGALYPDLWAGYTNWVGYTGDCSNSPAGTLAECGAGALTNAIDLVGSLEHVPGAHLYSSGDELVQVWTSTALQERLIAERVPHVLYQHPTADHFTYAVFDRWQKEADYTEGLRRVERPTHVRYRTDRSFWFDELAIRHDRAYWLSDIRPRHDGYADLDITTHGCGGTVPILGETAGAGPWPVPWVSTGLEQVDERRLERAPRFEATLSNVASFRIDVEDACLTDREVAYSVTTDGPVQITLTDGRSVEVPAGEHAGSIGPGPSRRHDGSGASGARSTLPATGGGTVLAAAASVALATATRRRR